MKLLLVDGTNVVMRYALAMLPKGHEPTVEEARKVLRGVHRAVLGLAVQEQAHHVIIALDSSWSFRRDLYEGYKANRDEGLTREWQNRAAHYFGEQGIMVLRAPGFEADDIIATLAARAGKAGKTCCVLSGDSDLLTIASLWTTVYQFGHKGEPRFVARNLAWIRAKYQLPSAGLLTLYKALVGESGDAIPGCTGIGPVKARQLLATYHSLDALCGSGKVDPDQLALMYTLVELREDVPLDPIVPAACRLTHSILPPE